jgi:hypothetical protein
VTPQPAAHIGQMLGFHSATPGTTSSSGTKRMSWCSGLPQLASVALVPVIAVSLMKSRRSICVNAAPDPPALTALPDLPDLPDLPALPDLTRPTRPTCPTCPTRPSNGKSGNRSMPSSACDSSRKSPCCDRPRVRPPFDSQRLRGRSSSRRSHGYAARG